MSQITQHELAALEAAASPSAAVETVVRENGLALAPTHPIIVTFMPLCEQVRAFADQAQRINVTDATQINEMEKARDVRLSIRKVRIAAEKARKDFKEESLRTGRAIDGIAKLVSTVAEPAESRLQDMEDFAKRAEEARQAKIKHERSGQLREQGVNPDLINLDGMHELEFQKLLQNARAGKKAREEQEAKEKADREAAEKARTDEDARIRADNEKLRIENAKEATARQQAEATRKAAEDKLIAIQNEAKAKADAEAKAARKAARAPDKEKILMYASAIRTLALGEPTVRSDEAKRVVTSIVSGLTMVLDSIERDIKLLD